MLKIFEKCGKSPEDFSSRKTFLKHLKNNDHMSNEAFECGQCEKSFKSKNGLGAHRQRYHKEILINCKYCQEDFTRKDALKRHVEKQHEATNFGISCRKCKGNFKNAESSKHLSPITLKHQHTDKVLCRSNYHVKDVQSDIHGQRH